MRNGRVEVITTLERRRAIGLSLVIHSASVMGSVLMTFEPMGLAQERGGARGAPVDSARGDNARGKASHVVVFPIRSYGSCVAAIATRCVKLFVRRLCREMSQSNGLWAIRQGHSAPNCSSESEQMKDALE
jgi:hypothetical protein